MPDSSEREARTGLSTWGRDFLWQFRINWLAFTLRGVSSILSSEPLVRFVTTRRWVDWKNRKVKEGAFLPRADNCTSMYRILAASDARLWRIGTLISSRSHEKTLFGKAVIVAKDVSIQGLALRKGLLPSRHVDLTGWPEKSLQKAKAIELARDAVFVEP